MIVTWGGLAVRALRSNFFEGRMVTMPISIVCLFIQCPCLHFMILSSFKSAAWYVSNNTFYPIMLMHKTKDTSMLEKTAASQIGTYLWETRYSYLST